jgi:hypothetical protein
LLFLLHLPVGRVLGRVRAFASHYSDRVHVEVLRA